MPDCLVTMPESLVTIDRNTHFVEFVSELPLTLTNKVEKYKLRARAECGLASLWDSQQHGGAIRTMRR